MGGGSSSRRDWDSKSVHCGTGDSRDFSVLVGTGKDRRQDPPIRLLSRPQSLLLLLGEGGREEGFSLPLPSPSLSSPHCPSPGQSWAPCVSGWAGRWAARGLSWCILGLPSPPRLLSRATPPCPAPINLPQPGLSSWPDWAVPRQSRSTVEGGGKMWTNF